MLYDLLSGGLGLDNIGQVGWCSISIERDMNLRNAQLRQRLFCLLMFFCLTLSRDIQTSPRVLRGQERYGSISLHVDMVYVLL